MKTMFKVLISAMLLAIAFCANSQVKRPSRPALFTKFSSVIPVSLSELDKAFGLEAGSTVKLDFSDKFSFTGTVISSVQKYSNLSSVIIKSSVLNNFLFSISKRINDDKSITYVGRIINDKYADGYELRKDNTGNYSFAKINTEDLVQDF